MLETPIKIGKPILWSDAGEDASKIGSVGVPWGKIENLLSEVKEGCDAGMGAFYNANRLSQYYPI